MSGLGTRANADAVVGRQECVFCLSNGLMRDEQVLMRGSALYVAAPRGQLLEGFLVVAPQACVGSLSQLPPHQFPELAEHTALIEDFYRQTYGVGAPSFYEQGRAGSGAIRDPADGFPLHAHLCCLPSSVDLHACLKDKGNPHELRGVDDLPGAVCGQPYVYTRTKAEAGCVTHRVYVAGSETQARRLEAMRLRPLIADALGMPERRHWRSADTDADLSRAIERFRHFLARRHSTTGQAPRHPA